jgi:hypothetical protein
LAVLVETIAGKADGCRGFGLKFAASVKYMLWRAGSIALAK